MPWLALLLLRLLLHHCLRLANRPLSQGFNSDLLCIRKTLQEPYFDLTSRKQKMAFHGWRTARITAANIMQQRL
jgi:hypothetical protein